MIPLTLTIYITDEPLGFTGPVLAAIPPLYVYIGIALVLLALIYLMLRPTPTVPPGGWP